MYAAVGILAFFVVKSFLGSRVSGDRGAAFLAADRETFPAASNEPPKKQAASPTAPRLAAKPVLNKGLDMLQAFKANAGNVVFSLQTATVGCSVGDFNMMAADASMRGAKKVLVTVESLQERDSAPLLSEMVDLNDFGKGRQWSVPVPAKLADVPLGVFICSDKSATKRCRGKEVKDINELWLAYRKASKGKGRYPGEDHVLMFQYLHRQGEGVRFLPADALLQFGSDSVKTTLVALNGSDSSGRRVAQDVYHYLDVLKSMPGRPQRDAIHFPLPSTDCP